MSGLRAAAMSAIFYYLACSPCRAHNAKMKARKRLKQDMEEHEKMILEQPQRYHHPMPFCTNPFWHEEIAMGPSLPKKASKNTSQRKLTSAGRDSSAGASLDGSTTVDTASTLAAPGGGPGVGGGGGGGGPGDDSWNRKRYQREDEELWGLEITKAAGRKIMEVIAEASSTAGRFVEAKLGGVAGGGGGGSASSGEKDAREVTDKGRYEFYYAPPRIPPVNDYHPPRRQQHACPPRRQPLDAPAAAAGQAHGRQDARQPRWQLPQHGPPQPFFARRQLLRQQRQQPQPQQQRLAGAAGPSRHVARVEAPPHRR